jgi:hypothetical protein
MIFFLNYFVAFIQSLQSSQGTARRRWFWRSLGMTRKGFDSGLIQGVGGCCNAPVSKPEACTAA